MNRVVENTDMDTDEADNQGKGKRQRRAPKRFNPSTLVQPPASDIHGDEESFLLEHCPSLHLTLGIFEVKYFQWSMIIFKISVYIFKGGIGTLTHILLSFHQNLVIPITAVTRIVVLVSNSSVTLIIY